MTYQIYYRPKDTVMLNGYRMFKIQYFNTLFSSSYDDDCSEISASSYVKGITYFLKDKQNDKNFDYDEFVNLSEEIQGMNGIVSEQPIKGKSICRVGQKMLLKASVKEKLEAFAKKYNLLIDTY